MGGSLGRAAAGAVPLGPAPRGGRPRAGAGRGGARPGLRPPGAAGLRRAACPRRAQPGRGALHPAGPAGAVLAGRRMDRCRPAGSHRPAAPAPAFRRGPGLGPAGSRYPAGRHLAGGHALAGRPELPRAARRRGALCAPRRTSGICSSGSRRVRGAQAAAAAWCWITCIRISCRSPPGRRAPPCCRWSAASAMPPRWWRGGTGFRVLQECRPFGLFSEAHRRFEDEFRGRHGHVPYAVACLESAS